MVILFYFLSRLTNIERHTVMKKSTIIKNIIKDLPKNIQDTVSSLKRLQLYYIDSNSMYHINNNNKQPAMLTHFTKYGLKFKILVNNNRMSINGYYHIKYKRLPYFTITPMKAEDLPLYAGHANQFMSDAFKRSIAF